MKKLILIDGNSLFFKAFYATFQNLKNNMVGMRSKSGNPVNALRTFSHLITNLKIQNPESLILVAFDEQNSETFRHKFDFYKAHRKIQPDELYFQIPLVKKFLELYGIKWISSKFHEADDIIGIVAQTHKRDIPITIITTDRDLLQLVDKNVDVFLSKSGLSNLDEYNIYNFSSKFFNLQPLQIPDFKAIMGDSSDNLKGIPGLGPKTAIDLLQKFHSFEKIYENLDSLSENVKSKLLNGKQSGLLTKQLATIITNDGDIQISLENLKSLKIDREKLIDFLMDNNIFNLISKI